jgi:ubiquinone/menaquinone biosynthesis C-methylase UbiE
MSGKAVDHWFFDVWSRGYDLALPQRLAYRPIHDAIMETLGNRPAARRLLDVGCGTGELAARISKAFPSLRVVGCDFSAGMLERAASKRLRVSWVRGDAGFLPFGAAMFDVVTSTEAFHWFPDQDAALREFRRVLVPGGRLLLAVATPPLELVSQIADVSSRLLGEPFHWPTRSEITARLERAKFRVDDQRRVFRFPGLLLLPLVTTAVSTARARRGQARRRPAFGATCGPPRVSPRPTHEVS